MKEKPKIGDILYCLNMSNYARNTEQKLIPVVVTKVGNKYFTTKEKLDDYWEKQYYLEDWREKNEYGPTSELFKTEQEYLDKKEKNELYEKIKVKFDIYSKNDLTLEQLRSINSIILNKTISTSK